MDQQTFDQAIENYEKLFEDGLVPDCEVFLLGLDHECDKRCVADNLLFAELLHTDLEIRIRKGLKGRVEYYLTRFPQIEAEVGLIKDLIQTEFKVRQYCEPGLEADEFERRFPKWFHTLEDESRSDNERQSGIDVVERIATFSDQASRFRKAQLHQTGGLGNVYLAKDTELNRQVAVKEIKAKYVLSDAHRARFARETWITSQLEHPGIVPVYGLGHRSDGTPYFAMQFIQGKTLKSAISAFHESVGESSKTAHLEFRRLLQRFLDVCNTIHYAHSQGVIHRDIKPSNIMIGPFGKTYVVDWGLAKVLATDSETQPEAPQGDGEPLLAIENDNTASVLGNAAGSPGFMSPEQTDGQAEQIGSAADIYSLGATLHNLITNEVPPGVQQLRSQGPANYWSQLRVAPWQRRLKSICALAMSFEPSKRYDSAAAMAEDIENYLLDLPLVAHQESNWEKLSRFSRNHRSIINTTTIATTVMLAFAVAAATWINEEKQTAILAKQSADLAKQTAVLERTKAENALKLERRAKASADRSNQEAEKRTHQLTKTVRMFTHLFSKSDERGTPRNLDRLTMSQALDELSQSMEMHPDPFVRSFLNSVFANRYEYEGDVQKASELRETALDLLEETGISETDPLYVHKLLEYGGAELAARRTEKTYEIAERAIDLGRSCKICPDCGKSHQPLLVRALVLKYRVALQMRQEEIADEAIKEAFELAQCVFEDKPTEPLLLEIMYYQADSFARVEKTDEAKKIFEDIIEVSEAKDLLHPRLVASRMQLAGMELKQKNLSSAEVLFEKTYREAEELFGKTHVQTIHAKSQYAGVLAWGTDPDKQERGIGQLLEIHQHHVNQGNKSRAMYLAIMLAGVYNRQDREANADKVVELINRTLSYDYDVSEVTPKRMWTVYSLLCNAHHQLGNRAEELQALKQKLSLANKLYGPGSKSVVRLTKKIAERESELIIASQAVSEQAVVDD